MNTQSVDNIRLSAEWAAFGDALGFMTELADVSRVQYRTGAESAEVTLPWRRKVGGYQGVSVELPAGAYSDDTQLRLATIRSIRADGTFDVSSFAKVELPAWLNYALGAGVSSKEAANNLTKPSVNWYSNFFSNKRSKYINAGGNGAAMRIQPHVWGCKNPYNAKEYLLDVFRNAICTHGHPRGFVGACFHAVSLAFSLQNGRPASLHELHVACEGLRILPQLILEDGDIRLLWLGPWEAEANVKFSESVDEVLAEIQSAISKLTPLDGMSLTQAYPKALDVLDAKSDNVRGSGVVTSLLAAFAASLSDIQDPKAMIVLIANALGSDTDSIATMAGAIVGSCTSTECRDRIQDVDYIRSTAVNLFEINHREAVDSFAYPDLRSWKPSKAAIDSVYLRGDQLYLNGIACLHPVGNAEKKKIGDEVLQWLRTDFGQTLLARVRVAPKIVSSPSERISSRITPKDGDAYAQPPLRMNDLFSPANDRRVKEVGSSRHLGARNVQALDEILRSVIDSNFSSEFIGRALLDLADQNDSDFVEKGIALTATILTAYKSRQRRGR